MKRLRFVLALMLILLAAATGCAFWMYQELRKPVSHARAGEYIEIPRGSSPIEIVNKLANAGIIGRAWPVLAYLKFYDTKARLKAGEYRFPSPISALGVIRKLEEGEQRLSRFTIIEGWTRWDIAAAMAHLPELKLPDAQAALALLNDTRPIREIDAEAQNLEGYLYPDTYSFPPNATAESMIAGMAKRFRQEWKPEWDARARELGMTTREIVTIASLIETEGKLKEDRPLIASVIYNRLARNMALGIDSSIVYASKMAGKWRNDGKVYKSDVERQSPYNTRLHSGLPPGPIASPGARSLEAALYPAQTDYLYYVRDPARNDGAHNFYADEAGFARGRQALRDWERTQESHGTSNEPADASTEP
ncbi:MAG: endolytic transglycosylase MltG [Pyrinomonadaceae bacterium]